MELLKNHNHQYIFIQVIEQDKKTQPEAEQSTCQEGEADEDTWQKNAADNHICNATVDRKVDDHN